MDKGLRIALLIDADNAPAAKVEPVLNELARHGVANVRRAYGNWKNPHLQKWEQMLHPHAIQPVQQFAYSTGKNASDMAMVVDAMDLLHSATSCSDGAPRVRLELQGSLGIASSDAVVSTQRFQANVWPLSPLRPPRVWRLLFRCLE